MADRGEPPLPPPAGPTEKTISKKKTISEKAALKKKLDAARGKTRVNIGSAFQRWRRLMQLHPELKRDEMVAEFLLDSFDKHSKGSALSIHTSVTRNAQPPPPSSNDAESQSDSTDCESSSNTDKQETCAASSANGKAPGKKVAAPQKAGSQDRRVTINLSQNEVNGDIQGDEEISTTCSVGDGRYTVDLGSSSEFIVDEECILQVFKSCRECNKQCSVRKRVQGLKIIVNQACYFCESRFTWTNLPDADEDDGGDLQVNGQTNTATSPSSNTS